MAPAGTSWWLQPLHWVVIKSHGYWSTCSSSFDRTWATELEWGGGGTHLLASRAALTLSGCGSSGRLHAPFSALAGNLWPGRGSGVRRVQGKANRVLHTWDFQMQALKSMWQVGQKEGPLFNLGGSLVWFNPTTDISLHMHLKYWKFPFGSSLRRPVQPDSCQFFTLTDHIRH